jgi:D-glycero-D-manno-heptose 1,7-bisphosphate phosphatase
MASHQLKNETMKLIILDRDGVINHDRSDYVKSADECVPIDGSIAAIARLHQAGFTVVIATNQSGLAQGKFDLDHLEAIHDKLTQLVEVAGGEICAIFYCPHTAEDNCKCRKPKTGLLDAIEAEFNVSAEGVPFVGDSLRDLQAGISKGCVPILVKTGNGLTTLDQLQNPVADEGDHLPQLAQVLVVDNLSAAAEYIINAVNETL